jgi:hypothetical protein
MIGVVPTLPIRLIDVVFKQRYEQFSVGFENSWNIPARLFFVLL